MRVAVVGAGFYSEYHLRGWSEVQGVELVGLCDLDGSRRSSIASRFGIEATFESVQEMLTVTQPDLVDVVTPPSSHKEILETVFATGTAVICQKPFCTSYSEASQLVAAAERAGLPLVVHENFRFARWYREARRLIDAGLFGQLHGISFRLRPGDGQGPAAYANRQPYFRTMPRLLVLETAIHFIDTFRFLIGEVEAVTARLRRINPVIRGEDAGLIIFEFENRATGLFDGNRLNDHGAANPRRTMGEMWLEGERGVLRLDGEARLWWKPHGKDEVQHEYDQGSDQPGGGACAALARHVVSCLDQGLVPETAGKLYLRNLRIQEAVYASHLSGKRIVVDEFFPS